VELDDIRAALTAESIANSAVLTASVRREAPITPAAPTAAVQAAAATPGASGLQTWRTGLWLRLLADNGSSSPETALRRMSIEKPGSTEAKAVRMIRQHKKARRLRFKFKTRQASVAAPKPVQSPAPVPVQ